MSYKVIKPFIYDGTPFSREDIWQPQGLRGDEAIIRARFVVPLIAVGTEPDAPTVPLMAATRARGRRVREASA